MNKLIAASAALILAMSPTFVAAQTAQDEDEDVILIGPGVSDATTIAAGAAGLLALALLLGGGDDDDDDTTTTTTTTTGTR